MKKMITQTISYMILPRTTNKETVYCKKIAANREKALHFGQQTANFVCLKFFKSIPIFKITSFAHTSLFIYLSPNILL